MIFNVPVGREETKYSQFEWHNELIYRDDQVVVGSFELLSFSHHVSIITPSIYGFLVCFKSAAVIMCGQWSLFNGALAEKSRLWGGGDGHALHCWQTNQ